MGAAIMLPGGVFAGVYSCTQLYEMGRAKKITNQMCKVTQFFLQQPCACREFPASNEIGHWTVKQLDYDLNNTLN